MTVLISLWFGILMLPIAQGGSVDEADRIPAKEREALVALYNSTGGPTWVRRDGWLGPPGSECQWYGVGCGRGISGSVTGKRTIQDLDLPGNGLTGQIPHELGALEGLKRLTLQGNKIKGPLPDSLLQRFDEGRLKIDPLSLIHDVDELEFDFSNSSMLCSGYKAKIRADGSVHLQRKLCRQDGEKGSEVYCEYREGRTYDFDMLGRFLVRNNFFSEPENSTTFGGSDIGQLTLIAKRRTTAPTTRTWTGPTSLRNWSLALVLEGVIARTEWNAPPTKRECSLSIPSAPHASP